MVVLVLLRFAEWLLLFWFYGIQVVIYGEIDGLIFVLPFSGETCEQWRRCFNGFTGVQCLDTGSTSVPYEQLATRGESKRNRVRESCVGKLVSNAPNKIWNLVIVVGWAVLGNIGGSTCFFFIRQCIVVVCIALWDRVAVGSSIERIELKEILLFFSYFWVRIPIYFLFLGHCHSYFPIFQVSFVTWHPVKVFMR